jgi:very-short-patch-repair endonuclease
MEFGERFEEYVKVAAAAEAVRYEEEVYNLCRRCESPIEALLLAAMHSHNRVGGMRHYHFCLADKPSPVPAFDEAAFIYTQVCVGEYRPDILILDATLPMNLREPRWMIVECDGHEYHERTKEQARRDKKRDRFFTAKEFKVLRFTGSEIWADPDACAEEIDENLAYNDHFRLRDR